MRREVRAHGLTRRLCDLAHRRRRAGRARSCRSRGEALEHFGSGLRRVPALDACSHALRVGLDLLVLGVARGQHAPGQLGELADLPEPDFPEGGLVLVALHAVPEVDMCHFVAEDRRQLCLRLEEVQHAGEDEDLSAGNRERVDGGGADDVELVLNPAASEVGGQRLADRRHVPRRLRVLRQPRADPAGDRPTEVHLLAIGHSRQPEPELVGVAYHIADIGHGDRVSSSSGRPTQVATPPATRSARTWRERGDRPWAS